MREYLSFDLRVEATADGLRARVVDSPSGQATHDFALPFSQLELENFLLRIGHTRQGVRRLESPQMQSARNFGGQLFGAIFDETVATCFYRSLDEAERRDRGLRIRLSLSDTPQLADIPWEYLYDPSGQRFLVLSSWTPLVRHLELPELTETLSVTAPLRILVMISSPSDYAELDVSDEWNKLTTALGDLRERGLVSLERMETATMGELQLRLRRGEYHVLHFIGHGGFDEHAQDGVLVLEDGKQRSRLVAGRDLGTILYDHRSLRLAVLNSCEGARSSTADPFAGTAQSLVLQGIPAVVAMQFEISDRAAITCAHEFYTAVADGFPLDAALAEARRAIFGLGNDVEWGTPVLYMRTTDGRIFDVDQTTALPAASPASLRTSVGAEPVAAVAELRTEPAEPVAEPRTEPVVLVPESAQEPGDEWLERDAVTGQRRRSTGRRGMVAAIAVVAIAGAYGAMNWLPGAGDAPVPKADTILFVSDRDGNNDIYRMELDGSGLLNLTDDPARDVHPAWSPDKRRVAFASDRDGPYALYVMNHDGTDLQKITNGGVTGDRDPTWSPDGSMIAFHSGADGVEGLFVVEADGGGRRRVTVPAGRDLRPAWSPDGEWLAFYSGRDGNREIYLIRPDGTELTRLTDDPGTDRHPTWSPDGQQLTFASTRDGSLDLFVMNADGSDLRNITNTPEYDEVQPNWSRTDNEILFQSDRTGNVQLWRIGSDGQDMVPVTDFPSTDSDPDW